MRHYLLVILGLGIILGTITDYAAQEAKSKQEPSDTTGTQRERPKKSLPKQKIKSQKPPKVETHPAGLDSLNPELYMPLLRQKDSTMNEPH